jgi:hypothetical protein
MSENEADRIARRIRRMEAELAHLPEPVTDAELDAAIAFAHRVGAPAWLVNLLEANRRRDDAAGPGR